MILALCLAPMALVLIVAAALGWHRRNMTDRELFPELDRRPEL